MRPGSGFRSDAAWRAPWALRRQVPIEIPNGRARRIGMRLLGSGRVADQRMKLMVMVRWAMAAMRSALVVVFGRAMRMSVRCGFLQRCHGRRGCEFLRCGTVGQGQCDGRCKQREDGRQHDQPGGCAPCSVSEGPHHAHALRSRVLQGPVIVTGRMRGMYATNRLHASRWGSVSDPPETICPNVSLLRGFVFGVGFPFPIQALSRRGMEWRM